MLTQNELADLLRRVNVRAVSEASGVCEKTIYRLRNLKNKPSYDTATKLEAACKVIARRKRAARVTTPAQRDAEA